MLLLNQHAIRTHFREAKLFSDYSYEEIKKEGKEGFNEERRTKKDGLREEGKKKERRTAARPGIICFDSRSRLAIMSFMFTSVEPCGDRP